MFSILYLIFGGFVIYICIKILHYIMYSNNNNYTVRNKVYGDNYKSKYDYYNDQLANQL